MLFILLYHSVQSMAQRLASISGRATRHRADQLSVSEQWFQCIEMHFVKIHISFSLVGFTELSSVPPAVLFTSVRWWSYRQYGYVHMTLYLSLQCWDLTACCISVLTHAFVIYSWSAAFIKKERKQAWVGKRSLNLVRYVFFCICAYVSGVLVMTRAPFGIRICTFVRFLLESPC